MGLTWGLGLFLTHFCFCHGWGTSGKVRQQSFNITREPSPRASPHLPAPPCPGRATPWGKQAGTGQGQSPGGGQQTTFLGRSCG